MVFGMTYIEFVGLIAAIAALLITILRARITPTAKAVELLLEPLNESLSDCSKELNKKEREIEILRKDHNRWKKYVVLFVKKFMDELEELKETLEEDE